MKSNLSRRHQTQQTERSNRYGEFTLSGGNVLGNYAHSTSKWLSPTLILRSGLCPIEERSPRLGYFQNVESVARRIPVSSSNSRIAPERGASTGKAHHLASPRTGGSDRCWSLSRSAARQTPCHRTTQRERQISRLAQSSESRTFATEAARRADELSNRNLHSFLHI